MDFLDMIMNAAESDFDLNRLEVSFGNRFCKIERFCVSDSSHFPYPQFPFKMNQCKRSKVCDSR